MANIIDLVRADHRHIMIWQAELVDRGHQGSDRGRRRALGSTWNTVAHLIDLHMSAEDEILALPLRAAGTRDPAQASEGADAHEDIREIIRETAVQPPGAPLWWRLATAALSAWAGEVDRQEHRILPEFARRTSAAQREALCREWRAFAEAHIRDQVPDAPPHVATCQLLRTRPSPGVPYVASAAFDPIYCTCPDCEAKLDRMDTVSPSSGTVPRHRWPVPAPSGGCSAPASPPCGW